MSDNHDPSITSERVAPDELTVQWRDTATLLVDSVVGWVNVANVPRLTLGQVVYKPGATSPEYMPVITLALPEEALRFMGNQMIAIANQIGSAEPNEQ